MADRDDLIEEMDEIRPNAPMRTETFRLNRPMIVGSEAPDDPFPIRMVGEVQHGFKRGSRELGCHTANLPDDAIAPMTSKVKTGIYFGYARVHPECPEGTPSEMPEEDFAVWPMVMSIGWNPFYKNEKLTTEVHIIHQYAADFYGHTMSVVVLGYIRPELDYTSKGGNHVYVWGRKANLTTEALIEDIQTDIKVALNSLKRDAYQRYETDPSFEA
ncbi:riboflavin kinase [Serendipita sp. 407]|nr:riboflavin kinase [Serendipita sp. 407]